MRGVLLTLLWISAAGCSSHLAQAGPADVRPVEGAAISRCRRVGAVEGMGGNQPSTAENERAATDEVRRKVAKLGGNAYAISRRDAGLWHTVVEADAYICPQWQPVRGLAPR